MEAIAKQGGWKEAEKTMTAMAKIKPKAWRAMGDTIGDLKDFTEAGGMTGLLDTLSETWSLQVDDAFSELTNEVTELIATVLDPFKDEIAAFINETTITLEGAVLSWKAILTGQWDDFFAWMDKNMSDDMKQFKNDFREGWDSFLNTMDKMWRGFFKDWEAFLSDPLGGLRDVIGIDPGLQKTFEDIGRGVGGFFGDLGKGWEGFWRDLGYR